MDKPQSKMILAALTCLLVTAIWGLTFPLMKDALAVLTPLWFLAIRFLLAALLLLALSAKRLGQLSRGNIRQGLLVGLLLWAAYYSQTYGLTLTTAGNCAVITGLYVVLVPLLGWFFTRRLRAGQLGLALVAFLALAAFTLNAQLQMAYGDLLVLLCAVIYALHMIMLGRYSPGMDSMALAALQISVCAALNLLGALLLEPLPALSAVFAPDILRTLLFTAVFATVFAYVAQTAVQKILPPATTALLLTSEALFGAIFGWLLLDEILLPRQIAAGALLLACMAAAVLAEERQTPLQAAEQPGG